MAFNLFSIYKRHLVVWIRLMVIGLPIFLFSLTISAQNDPYKSFVEGFVKKRDTSGGTVAKKFRDYRRDTLKMQMLIEISAKNNYLPGQIYGHNALGYYFRDKSHYKRAIENHKKAIKLSEELNNDSQKIRALNGMGVVYRRMDAVRSALDYHQQALTIAEKIENKSNEIKYSTAVSLNSIGNIYISLKQYDLAEAEFLKAMVYERELDNKLGLAINFQNIGYCYEQRRIFDEALTNYRKSMGYNKEINSKLGKAICNNSIGQVYLKQDNAEEALKLISPTIDEFKELGDHFYIAIATINTGWAYTELGDYTKAEEYLKEGLRVSQKHGLQTMTAEAYHRLSRLMEKQQRYNSALQYNKYYQEEEGKVLNENNSRYISDLLIKYESDKQKAKIELLEKENEIVKIKLSQNQRIFLYGSLLFLMVAISTFLLYRQRKLEHQKRLLTIEQKLLRTQMNPHFIFNSLLSIKIYMLNNDRDSAVEYLNKFSKLVRTILATSLEKEISLKEELETMKLYVNIENIRLNNEVNYEVNVDKNIALENVKIPSLTLQPFIENALWHGLSAKDGKKSLKLNVSKEEENFIEISIIDNGIGRQNTVKIKDGIENRKSIGINLTKERLRNFFRHFKNMHSLSILDLFDDAQQPTGTKVVLRIPMK
ncbi:tetratricopeptide repeat-containing sensor histidine kinase [Spongiivirga citrea]|uniref:Tetratricopeptide repeat protein n=1 Tax=Spongiivirga citrea TaxID=1481457 RepID=A0A6M0CRY7_9FLAO|nr:tetratricopeptide repeat protein [Spongiivirga citrea]NER18864.1 tetratricopeptide repeat protein [Spongiivirga citrea]